MKLIHIAIVGIACLWLNTCLAGIPPKYLSVPNWESCTDTYYKKGAEFACLPDTRPSNCPKSSWKKLNRGNMLDQCPAAGSSGSTGMGSTAPGSSNNEMDSGSE